MKITRDNSQLCLLRIDSPWPELGGGLQLEFPEWTSGAGGSWFFNRKGLSVLNQFSGAVGWRISDDGCAAEFSCDYERAVTLRGKIEIENDRRIKLMFGIDNHSQQTYDSLKVCICVMTKIETFDLDSHSDTLIYVSGKAMPIDRLNLISGEPEQPELLHFYFKDFPFRGVEGAYHSEEIGAEGTDPYGLKELSDLPFVIRKSRLGHKYIGVAWTRPGFGVANRMHPCIHVNPIFPEIPPGQSIEANGWIAFGEGTLSEFKDQQKKELRRIRY